MKTTLTSASVVVVAMLAPGIANAKPMTSYVHPTKSVEAFQIDMDECGKQANEAAAAIGQANNPAGNAAGAFGAGFAEGLAKGKAMNEAWEKCSRERGYTEVELTKEDVRAFKKTKKDQRQQWMLDYYVKRSGELPKNKETPST